MYENGVREKVSISLGKSGVLVLLPEGDGVLETSLAVGTVQHYDEDPVSHAS